RGRVASPRSGAPRAPMRRKSPGLFILWPAAARAGAAAAIWRLTSMPSGSRNQSPAGASASGGSRRATPAASSFAFAAAHPRQPRRVGDEAALLRAALVALAEADRVLVAARAAKRELVPALGGLEAEGLIEAPPGLDIGHRKGDMLEIADHLSRPPDE